MALEFIVVHNKASSMKTLWKEVDLALESHGIIYRRTITSEGTLLTGKLDDHSAIPHNAVLYVHGNLQSGYDNVGLTVKLAKQRPDLRFVVQLDSVTNREYHFGNPDDALFAKERLENQSLADQIIVTTEDFFEPTFFRKHSDQPQIDVYLQEACSKIAAYQLPNPVQQQQGYHIYIVHDRPERILTDRDYLEIILSGCLGSEKVPHITTIVPESCLESGEDEDFRPFPEGALLLIHGNMFEHYPNLRKVRALEEEGPNLRYIIFLDKTRRENFYDDADYVMAKGFLERGFDPSSRINILPVSLGEFIHGGTSGNPKTEQQNFGIYFKAWQEQRGAI